MDGGQTTYAGCLLHSISSPMSLRLKPATIAVSTIMLIMISDCVDPASDPNFIGYTLGSTSGLTYQSIYQVSGCATGYEGAASPTVTCAATGIWTAPTGCARVGKSNLDVSKVGK